MQELEKKWRETRAIACSSDPSRKRKLSAINMTSYQSEEDYANFFQEGDVFTPAEFLEQKGFDARKVGNEEKQVEFLQDLTCVLGW